MELILGGISASVAGVFTNPLEVVKTRLQLQGELKARGQYTVHYKNFLQAFYTVYRFEGVRALQKGLVPAVCYQFVMNGLRLGCYQVIVNAGLTKTTWGAGRSHASETKSTSERNVYWRTVLAGALSGCLGAFLGSPLYMVKTHLQARSLAPIAVGVQHKHGSMSDALVEIYRRGGVPALWRGVSGALCRVSVGSAAQLSTFSQAKQLIIDYNKFSVLSYLPLAPNGLLTAFLASALSGVVVVSAMTPFDVDCKSNRFLVISTRLYNQNYSAATKGSQYSGVLDCGRQIIRSEGLFGLYKGMSASFYRLAPHTILSLVIWDQSRRFYNYCLNG